MEKDKSRGLKHIKDKRKYKGNSVKNVKYIPPKTNPSLGSNWDRYDTDEDNEPKLDSSTDFALLSKVPISTGSHFQFKSDNIEKEIHTEKTDLFCLDLNLLQQSILTIPLYERIGIEKTYFEKNEIITMDQDAQKHIPEYNKLVENKINDSNLHLNSEAIEYISENLPDSTTNVCNDEREILELIDNCEIVEDNTVPEIPPPQVANDSKQDLEEWLDDILEN